MRSPRVRAAGLAFIATALSACLSYDPPPPLPPTEPATGIPIYVVVGPPPEEGFWPRSYRGNWAAAAEFGRVLDDAGFEPFVVASYGEVPTDAISVDGFKDWRPHPRAPCTPWGQLSLLTFFTGGVIPTYGCMQFGYSFALRRPATAEPQPLKAYWRVDFIQGWLAALLGAREGYSVHLIDVPGKAGDDRVPAAVRVAILEALGSGQARSAP